MSSRNSENDAAAMGLALVGLTAIFLFAFVFIGLAIFTGVMSLLCLFALFKPLKIGKLEIKPGEARGFLLRGIVGWFAFPFLIIGIAPAFDIKLQQDWVIYLMMTGYMIGSLGVGYILEKLYEEEPGKNVVPAEPSEPPTVIQHRAPEPFEFATWDDEEERRK